MATTEQADTEQCRALTDDGGRCSRPAQEDGFCYQHDESDPTVDEDASDDGAEGSDDQESQQSADADSEQAGEDAEGGGEDPEADADPGSASADDETADAGDVDEEDRTVTEEDLGESDSTILGVRRTVQGTATGLIGQPLDSITEVTATEDGWRAIVEVVERSSVPDTQDILGQYEIELSDDIEVRGYRRIDRYRRSDTDK